MDKLTALKEYFGHSAFRQGQEGLVDTLLSGGDVLGVMPTGAGKSVCYQLPAVLLPGVTLVISPLISLMKDQVAALVRSGVAAAYLNSSLTPGQRQTVLQRTREGAYKVLYVAPERLTTPDFLLLARGLNIPLVAVDEAHCISQWGQDFRPSYLKISGFLDSLPRRPAVGAFTATATQRVKEDIRTLLALREPLEVTTGFDRPNLYFEVVRPRQKRAYLLQFLARRPGQSGIVYCSTRKQVESVCEALRESGVAAARYHAGLEDRERRENQEDFLYDRVRVMVATNAFGMGIDKSNVSFVVHYNMPQDLESYYQEAGRAGRDGEKAHCVLLYSAGDVRTARFLIENAREQEELDPREREAAVARDLERLDRMVDYCKTNACLRACILDYFGERGVPACGNCGNCRGVFQERDITLQAQQILSGVARVERKYVSGLGVTLIVRMLHGSTEQRVLQLGLDSLPTYGIMKGVDRRQIRAYIDRLLEAGYLVLTGGEYPVLRLTPRAGEVLFRGERVSVTERMPTPEERRAGARRDVPAAPPEEGLLSALKALRGRLAQEEQVPAYIIFSNAALADMAARQPATLDEFLQVSGVGQVKAARYGKQFLSAIRTWRERQEETLCRDRKPTPDPSR